MFIGEMLAKRFALGYEVVDAVWAAAVAGLIYGCLQLLYSFLVGWLAFFKRQCAEAFEA